MHAAFLQLKVSLTAFGRKALEDPICHPTEDQALSLVAVENPFVSSSNPCAFRDPLSLSNGASIGLSLPEVPLAFVEQHDMV